MPLTSAGAPSHQEPRLLFWGFPCARHLPVWSVAAHRAGGARSTRAQEGDVCGARDPDALFTVRQEDRRGGRGCEAKAAWGPEKSALGHSRYALVLWYPRGVNSNANLCHG